MNSLFLFAAHNSLVALVLAVLAYLLTRVWRNPPVAHLLWVLILLKLVAPPVLQVNWSVFVPPGWEQVHDADSVHADGWKAETTTIGDHSSAAGMQVAVPATAAGERGAAAGTRPSGSWLRPVLLGIWFGVAALSALAVLTRIVRFERLLRHAMPAPDRLQRLALDVSATLGVHRAVDLCILECVGSPFVWCLGRRAAIVLPLRRICELDDRSVALILAHELAHLRRRDHWVRIVELLVSIVLWWNPLVWAIRRQVHQAEDLCCDAWVRWGFPDCTTRYAEVLLETAESLSARLAATRFPLASPFLRSLSLKARVEMVLEGRFAPFASRKWMFIIALLACFVLPAFVGARKLEARASSTDDAPASAHKPGSMPALEFPKTVPFQQGAIRFLKGDRVTILEIRGTADSFKPGNIYWIRGTYSLASHQKATLAAYTTARDAKDGKGISYGVQTTTVDQGDGTFTLILPMSCRGWPHVSFYPADGGSDFGGNYFGTGDSVLKKWWGEKE
jgi:beta-lactamase regulating signal transducer with metallopeptidase domain